MHRVELAEIENIVARGRRTVTWCLRAGQRWVRAAEQPNARIVSLDAGPGTVWEHLVELELPAGSVLMRIESSPVPERRRQALEYLMNETRAAARRVRRTYFKVARDGSLQPI
jgi:hypothetical protein